MKNISIAVLFLLGGSLMYLPGQAKQNDSTKVAVPSKATSDSPNTSNIVAGEVTPGKQILVPKSAKIGDQTVSGDILVSIQLDKLKSLDDSFQKEIEPIQTKYRPISEDIVKAIKSAVDSVKRDNGWGDDVQYDPATRTWSRVTPERK